MTAAGGLDPAAKAVRDAYDAIDAYARTYGEVPLRLLLHAAVPQSFRADFLNLLKINFVPEAGGDFSVDADVLLSPLVETLGGGYRRLGLEVRRQCIDLLDAAYRWNGPRRSARVARFMLAYIDHVERQRIGNLDPRLSEHLAVQRWVAFAFLDPNAVARALAERLHDAVAPHRAMVSARLGGVAAALSIPLAGHQPLLDYARGIDAILSGNEAAARDSAGPFGDDEPHFEGLTLPSLKEILAKRQARHGAGAGAGAGEGRAITAADFAVFRDVDAPWCPELVALPAGEFLMGSPESEEGRFVDEGPRHRVTIGRRFALGRYPVTFEEYDHFCVTQLAKPKDGNWGRGRRPVINVIWRDAVYYCDWLSRQTDKLYRLPSEAEWEYACRARTTTRYSFGDAITPKDANYAESKIGKTTEVGSYPPNPWGLHDMHGNVWEWVEDVWHDSYNGAPVDGSAWTDEFLSLPRRPRRLLARRSEGPPFGDPRRGPPRLPGLLSRVPGFPDA